MAKKTAKSPAAKDMEDAPHTETTKGAIRAVVSGEAADVGGVAGKRLKSFLERIERLEAEKAGIAADIKDIYAEAKGVGFDSKIIKRIISLRKLDPEKRREEQEILDLYMSAVGMQ